MKTKHIIAIGLLSATAIALLGIALAKSNKKPKTLQTNAYYEIDSFSKPTNTDNPQNQMNYEINATSQAQYTSFIFTRFESTLSCTYENDKTSIYFSIKPTLVSGNTTGHNLTITPYTYTKNDELVKVNSYEIYVYELNITNENNQTKFSTSIGLLLSFTDKYNYTFSQNEVFTFESLITYEQPYTSHLQLTLEKIDNLADFMTDIYTYGTNNYTQGETAGYNTGYTAGESAGYDVGYGIGYADAGIYNEVIDLRGTMLQILTMPFTFITQAFDVTIFPNTPYAFNFSRLIMGILAISAILFIIKLFTSGLSILGNYTTNINKEATMRSDNRKSKQAYKAAKTAKKAQQLNKDK